MPVVTGDLELRLSIPGGGPGDSDPQPDPDDSLGEFMSTTVLVDNVANNLMRDMTGAEGQAGVTLYRCLFVVNTNVADTWGSVALWVSSQESGGAEVAIGLDPAGAVAMDSASDQAATIADEETAPTGVTFSTPTTQETGLALGDIGPEECYAFWFRWTLAADSPAKAADDVVFALSGLAEP